MNSYVGLGYHLCLVIAQFIFYNVNNLVTFFVTILMEEKAAHVNLSRREQEIAILLPNNIV